MPAVHPDIANIYRFKIATFIYALNEPNGGRSAAEALRSRIGEIVLMPGCKRGEVPVELRGELTGILDFATPGESCQPGQVMTAVKASPCKPRFHNRQHRSGCGPRFRPTRSVSAIERR